MTSKIRVNEVESLDGKGRGVYSFDYEAGLVIEAYSTVIRDGDTDYRLSDTTTLPYTTTGAGMPEGGAFVSVGDAVLRQELADPEQGGDLVQVSTSTGEQTLVDALQDRWDVVSVGSSTPVPLSQRFARTVKVRDFGAVGDGVTDDTSAFAAAILRAEAEGLPIDLEGGDFLVGELSTSGVSIISDSGGSLIKLSAAATIIDSNGASDFHWRGFDLVGQNSSGRAYEITNAGNVRIEDVGLSDWVDRVAIFENAVNSALVTGGVVKNISSPDVFVYKASNAKFSGIHFVDCDEHVIRFGRFTGDPSVLSRSNQVAGCSFSNILNDPILYEVDSRQGVVSNNTFLNCRRVVKIETTSTANTRDFIVSNNTFVGQSGVGGEIIKAQGVVRCRIIGNHLDGGLQGISAGAQSSVVGNYVRNITEWGIRVDSACSVSSNTLDNIGQDAIRGESSTTSNRVAVSANFVSNADEGVVVYESNWSVNGNIISSTSFGIRILSTSSGSIVTSNVATSGTAISDAGSTTVLANNVTV